MERFISWKLNRNMKTAGVSAIRAAPRTMRVRRRAPRAAAALIRVELEDVAQQEQQQNQQQQKDDDGEAGEGQGLAGGFRIEKLDIGGLKAFSPPSTAKNSNTPAAKKDHGPPPRAAFEEHGGIIEADQGRVAS